MNRYERITQTRTAACRSLMLAQKKTILVLDVDVLSAPGKQPQHTKNESKTFVMHTQTFVHAHLRASSNLGSIKNFTTPFGQIKEG